MLGAEGVRPVYVESPCQGICIVPWWPRVGVNFQYFLLPLRFLCALPSLLSSSLLARITASVITPAAVDTFLRVKPQHKLEQDLGLKPSVDIYPP